MVSKTVTRSIMMCLHKGPLVLHNAFMWMLYFSHFFTSFFTGLLRICLHAKVRDSVFIICLLLVGIDCVTDKLNEKHALLSSNLAPRMHFRALKFQNFLGHNAPRAPPPPQRKGTNGSVGYPLYSNLLATSIFIEIPAWKHSLLSSLLAAQTHLLAKHP